MRWYRPQHLIRLAAILLLVVNVVPEALAALPICSSDFGPAHAPVTSTAFRHSHDTKAAHECVATTPDKQTLAHFAQFASDTPAVFPVVLAHPAARLVARGASPRGSPAHRNTYLSQRSSVLLLT